jgi:DNA-directed RNA polymerase alpha subunit
MGSEMESTKLAAVSSPTLVKGPQSITKPSAAQLKKKKVTKKALKEQAAELFSYTSDPFAAAKEVGQSIDTLNIHEVDLMSGGNEVSSNTNNQQSHQEVSSLTEFTTIPFVRESFLEILLNLKACVFENSFAFGEVSSEVLKGKLILNATQESLDDLTEVSQELFFQTESSQHPSEGVQGQVTEDPDQQSKKVFPQGRRVREYKIWAKDLILPPGLKVKNPDLVLATLVAPKTNCELELSFEKIFQPDLTTLSMKTGRPHHRAEQQRRNVPIDGTLFPIKKVNFALSYTKFQKEVVTFEIWTNGSINPKAAIFQCVEKILTLFQNLRESEVKEIDSFAETAADEFE